MRKELILDKREVVDIPKYLTLLDGIQVHLIHPSPFNSNKKNKRLKEKWLSTLDKFEADKQIMMIQNLLLRIQQLTKS